MTQAIVTDNLTLSLKNRDETLAFIASMSAEDRKQLSADWLRRVNESAFEDPWVHGFVISLRSDGVVVGSCGYKGPPDTDAAVEIAYAINPEYQGRGYATEAARGLAELAFRSPDVKVVRAHTLPVDGASPRVLTKCGFQLVGEVIDPEDGLVWRWEKRKEPRPRPIARIEAGDNA